MRKSEIGILLQQQIDAENLSQKQKEVLLASSQLFAKKGYENTSTKDIAQLAGVAEGTVYKHFKTKEALLNAILLPFVEQVIPQIAQNFFETVKLSQKLSFQEFLAVLITDRIEFFLANIAEVKIFIMQVLQRPQFMQSAMAGIFHEAKMPMHQVFQYYQDQGELVQLPDIDIIRYLVSPIFGHLVPIMLGSEPVEIDVQATATQVSEFLAKGLKP